MSIHNHTYGPTCRLAPSATSTGRSGEDDIPAIKIQFFYASPLPIDDPLTAIPTPAGSESKAIRHPPRPFSAYDNNCLEESWLSLASKKDKKSHNKPQNIQPTNHFSTAESKRRALIVSSIATKHNKEHDNEEPKPRFRDEVRKSFRKSCRPLHKKLDAKDSAGTDSRITRARQSDVARTKSLFVCAICNNGPGDCTCVQGKVGCEACPSSTSRIAKINIKKAAQPQDDSHLEAEFLQLNLGVAENINSADAEAHDDAASDEDVLACCAELERDVKIEFRDQFSGLTKRRDSTNEQKKLMKEVLAEAKRQRELKNAKLGGGKLSSRSSSKKRDAQIPQGDATYGSDSGRTVDESIYFLEESGAVLPPAVENWTKGLDLDGAGKNPMLGGDSIKNIISAAGNLDAGTTGSPFQRVPSRSASPRPHNPSPASSTKVSRNDHSHADNERVPGQSDLSSRAIRSHKIEDCSDDCGLPSGSYADVTHGEDSEIDEESFEVHRCKAHKSNRNAEVAVGISRLHLVKLPALQMQPIYWSPVHDIAVVTRGTWFYRDTMYPVEPAVSNQLELGYRELRPWSETWADELNSAIEVGAAGEEKISHNLWPLEAGLKPDPKGKTVPPIPATDPYCAAKCYNGEVAAEGTIDLGNPDDKPAKTTEVVKRFPNCQVIYKDGEQAFILKPTLQPSEYFGRRPLAKIRRGFNVGIHVVRGFDWAAWEKLHPSKKDSTAKKAEHGAAVAGASAANNASSCSACLKMEERPKVTDLVFVIHGIGQKLSERVESFHFTHAINSFRRSVNVELGNEAVQKVLRDDLGGVMVLPINWRSNLSFEEGGPMRTGDKDKAKHHAADDYSLKDITPDTIPAVRNLISDVMLDIPFYMSQHKPKMISALIAEANRVYRLWCKNNPKFHEEGRVHIIAHSLGSAMALDVLSKQPTFVKNIKLETKVQTKHFEFDTKNLFFVGSPAGFFLLLDKGKLMPRHGRAKPGVDPADDNSSETTGDVGTFGCLAVDNLYNVMHCNDPIAYKLNATIDPVYASSLKSAHVPSATVGWLEALGNKVRSITPGAGVTAVLVKWPSLC